MVLSENNYFHLEANAIYILRTQKQYILLQLEGGGVASGGLRELIPCIARTAVAVGVDGIFMEVGLIVWYYLGTHFINFIGYGHIILDFCLNLIMIRFMMIL